MEEFAKERTSLLCELITLQHATAHDEASLFAFHGFSTVHQSTPLDRSLTGGGVGRAGQANGNDINMLSSMKANFYMYKPSEPPSFMDPKIYAGYPIFKREWQNVLQVGKSSVWTIANFNRYTKDKVDLSACRTVEEAWNELDMHFANPMTVSADVMSNFANYKLEGN